MPYFDINQQLCTTYCIQWSSVEPFTFADRPQYLFCLEFPLLSKFFVFWLIIFEPLNCRSGKEESKFLHQGKLGMQFNSQTKPFLMFDHPRSVKRWILFLYIPFVPYLRVMKVFYPVYYALIIFLCSGQSHTFVFLLCEYYVWGVITIIY